MLKEVSQMDSNTETFLQAVVNGIMKHYQGKTRYTDTLWERFMEYHTYDFKNIQADLFSICYELAKIKGFTVENASEEEKRTFRSSAYYATTHYIEKLLNIKRRKLDSKGNYVYYNVVSLDELTTDKDGSYNYVIEPMDLRAVHDLEVSELLATLKACDLKEKDVKTLLDLWQEKITVRDIAPSKRRRLRNKLTLLKEC